MKTTLQYKWIVGAFILIVAFAAALVLVLLFYKIEVITSSKIQIDKNGTSNIIVPNEEIYKFKLNDFISFKINDDFFKAKIIKINFDEAKKLFYLNIDSVNHYLIPNTWIDVQIIKDYQSILSSLMGV